MQHRRFSSDVGYSGRSFFPLCDTVQKISGWLTFFSIVGYNRKGFPLFRDTTEEVFSVVGYNGRGFFYCGIQWRK
jgi:hypothetical protein